MDDAVRVGHRLGGAYSHLLLMSPQEAFGVAVENAGPIVLRFLRETRGQTRKAHSQSTRPGAHGPGPRYFACRRLIT